MTDNEYIKLVVSWKEQRRPVMIKINDDITAIEKAIIHTYQLTQFNSLSEYQIQYYDTDHEDFIDLYSDTFHIFQQLLHKLSSIDAPPKSTPAWTLKIVSKTICHTLHESITDDTYNYQQENDPTELLKNEEMLSIMDNPSNDTQPSFLSSRSKTDTPGNVFNASTSQNIEEDESSQLDTINSNINISHEHPYGLDFDCNLADHQRIQFECEMIRKGPLKTTIGGVLVRASHKMNATSTEDISYPTVHFSIPTGQLHLNWSLYIYILTEPDKYGVHYLHASKGIFDHHTNQQDKFGIISNTELVNPYGVELSKDNLRDGKYEIRVKVCNIRNLCTRKREQLREFPRLNTLIIYHDDNLLSKQTTCDLKFSSEKYHLGCILIYQNKAYDRCISSVTIANRKRNDTDKAKEEDDETPEKKKTLK